MSRFNEKAKFDIRFEASDWEFIVDGVNCGYIPPSAPEPANPRRGAALLTGEEKIESFPDFKSPEAEQMRADVLSVACLPVFQGCPKVSAEDVLSFFEGVLDSGGAAIFCPEVMKLNPLRLWLESGMRKNSWNTKGDEHREFGRRVCKLLEGYMENGKYAENGLHGSEKRTCHMERKIKCEKDKRLNEIRAMLPIW